MIESGSAWTEVSTPEWTCMNKKGCFYHAWSPCLICLNCPILGFKWWPTIILGRYRAKLTFDWLDPDLLSCRRAKSPISLVILKVETFLELTGFRGKKKKEPVCNTFGAQSMTPTGWRLTASCQARVTDWPLAGCLQVVVTLMENDGWLWHSPTPPTYPYAWQKASQPRCPGWQCRQVGIQMCKNNAFRSSSDWATNMEAFNELLMWK